MAVSPFDMNKIHPHFISQFIFFPTLCSFSVDISLFKDESQIEKKSALMEGSESATPALATGRKSRRGVTSSSRKSLASATPSTSTGYKRKRDASSTAKSSSSSRKSLTKKRKTLVKRKRKMDHSDGEDDDDESSDDYESDTEYKPTQKRSTLNVSGAAKSAPRAQRSPLAKARAASPITPTTSRSKSVPQKVSRYLNILLGFCLTKKHNKRRNSFNTDQCFCKQNFFLLYGKANWKDKRTNK